MTSCTLLGTTRIIVQAFAVNEKRTQLNSTVSVTHTLFLPQTINLLHKRYIDGNNTERDGYPKQICISWLDVTLSR